MIVYFVRHGESEAASKGVFQSDDDTLSILGKRQAEILSRRLSNLQVDSIFSSPLERAQETGEIIAKKIGKSVEIWDDLKEARSPKEIVGRSLDDSEVGVIRTLIKKNFHKGNWKYSDEETFNELRQRAEKVLQRLVKMSKKQNILCVSHAGIIKMILAKMIFGGTLKPQIYWDFKYHLHSENTGVTVCEYNKKKTWILTTWNDTTHL